MRMAVFLPVPPHLLFPSGGRITFTPYGPRFSVGPFFLSIIHPTRSSQRPTLALRALWKMGGGKERGTRSQVGPLAASSLKRAGRSPGRASFAGLCPARPARQGCSTALASTGSRPAVRKLSSERTEDGTGAVRRCRNPIGVSHADHQDRPARPQRQPR
jgi:hypothetical protein